MFAVYLAETVSYPALFIGNCDSSSQMTHDGFLSLDQQAAQDWVAKKKSQYKVKSSRVALLPEKNLKSVFMPHDNEIQITVEVPGSLMSDHKPKSVYLTIREDMITEDMRSFAKNFIWKAEFKRQAQWKKEQKRKKK